VGWSGLEWAEFVGEMWEVLEHQHRIDAAPTRH